MKQKVVLEFEYPTDEDALLFATKGADMYEALSAIKLAVTGEFSHKADMAAVLARIRVLTDDILSEMGSL